MGVTSISIKEEYVRASLESQNGGEIAVVLAPARGKDNYVYTINSVYDLHTILGASGSNLGMVYSEWLIRRGHVLKVIATSVANGEVAAWAQTESETPVSSADIDAVAAGTGYNGLKVNLKFLGDSLFSVEVYEGADLIEEFSLLSTDVNSPYYYLDNFNSNLVKFGTEPTITTLFGSATPAVGTTVTGALAGGAGVHAALSSATIRTAFTYLQNKEVMFATVIVPTASISDISTAALPSGADAGLLSREDIVLLLDSTSGSAVTNSSYVAEYYPKVRTKGLGYIPASLALAGLIGDLHINKQIFKAPAGVDTGLLDYALGLSETLTASNVSSYQANRVNPIITRSGVGVVVWGQSTTASSAADIQDLAVRLLTNWLKRTLYDLSLNYMFRENTQFTWDAWKGEVDPILRDIENVGGIKGFRTICDATLMTPEEIDAGVMRGVVEFQPLSYITTIEIKFSVSKNGVTVE